jgi:hypothetical protein
MRREGRQRKLTWPSTSAINRLLEMVTIAQLTPAFYDPA